MSAYIGLGDVRTYYEDDGGGQPLLLLRRLPNAQLAIVPGTGHGVLAEKPDLCNRLIDFLTE